MNAVVADEEAEADETLNSFAVLLRRLRLSRHLTQEELAYDAGLSVRAVRNAELGSIRCPRRDSVLRLATALGLAADESHRLTEAAQAQRVKPVVPAAMPAGYVHLTADTSVIVLLHGASANGFSVLRVDAVKGGTKGESAIRLTLVGAVPTRR